MENSTTELLDETIVIPPGQFSAPEAEQKNKEEILKDVSAFLTLPERAKTKNKNIELPQALGKFLVKQEYIKNIAMHDESWAFEYNSENKTIYISEEEMPLLNWGKFFFRKYTEFRTRDDEENIKIELGPMHLGYSSDAEKDELDVYRFLHETVHSYQDYLKDSESAKRKLDPRYYYDNSVNQIINTPLAKLFSFCYGKRKKIEEKTNLKKGLSTWGSIENYNFGKNEEIKNKNSEYATRALEDTNELLTMLLWNQKYFETYIDHLTNSFKTELSKKGLAKLKEPEAEQIQDLVHILVEDMKESINSQN